MTTLACRYLLTRLKTTKPSYSVSYPTFDRPFTTSPASSSSIRTQTLSRRRIDDQITSEWIRLVDPSSLLNQTTTTTKTLLEPARTRDVLARLDRIQYALIELDRQASPPVCKLIKRTELTAPKARRPVTSSKSNTTLKEFQISSSIAPHDLDHKLKLVHVALVKGHQVRTVIKMGSNASSGSSSSTPFEFLEFVKDKMMNLGADLLKQEFDGQKIIIIDWNLKLTKTSTSTSTKKKKSK